MLHKNNFQVSFCDFATVLLCAVLQCHLFKGVITCFTVTDITPIFLFLIAIILLLVTVLLTSYYEFL